MAVITNTRSSDAMGAGTFSNVFASARNAFSTWNSIRMTRKSLSRLTNAELDDIGLCRGDIELVARGAQR